MFIRVGLPYKVVGGVRFYERREIRDAIAYLRAIANRTDDVSVRRILNVPKRGIGDRAEGAVAELAARERISFGEALRRVDEIGGLASRSARLLTDFAEFLDAHEAMVAEGVPADQILTSVLERSGYLASCRARRTRRTRRGWRTWSSWWRWRASSCPGRCRRGTPGDQTGD